MYIQICGSAVDIENKCVIVDFSSPVDLQISSNESYEHQKKKYNVAYKSHIEIGENNDLKTYFRFNNCIFIQVGDSIYPSDFGRHKDVTILSIVISKTRDDLLFENVKDYIYAEKDQVKLRQKRLKNLDPEGFTSMQEKIKENDWIRDKTSSRRAMHRKVDQVRDKSSPRKCVFIILY